MPAKPACWNRWRRSRPRCRPPAIGPHASASATLADLLAELPRLGQPDVVFNLFEGFAGVGRGEALVAGWIEALGHAADRQRSGGAGTGARQGPREMAAARRRLADGRFCAGRARSAVPRAALAELLAAGPAIVKPAHEDASLGIGPHSVVSDRARARGADCPGAGRAMARCWSSDLSPAANSTPRWWHCPSRDCCRLAEIEFARSSAAARAIGDLRGQMGRRQCRRSGHRTALPGPGRRRLGPADRASGAGARSRRPVAATTPGSICAWPTTRAFTFSKSTAIPTLAPRPVSPGRWVPRESATTSSSTVWCGMRRAGGRNRLRPSNCSLRRPLSSRAAARSPPWRRPSVASMSASVWAAETNRASYWLQGM